MKTMDYMLLFSTRDASLLTTKITLASFLLSFQVHPDRFIEISSKFKIYNIIIFIQTSVGKPFPEEDLGTHPSLHAISNS